MKKTMCEQLSPSSSLIGKQKRGIHSLTACLFVVGEMTGAALLAMPLAVRSAGLVAGPLLMFFTCIQSTFCGILISKCWLMLESSDETLRDIQTRDPYALIGEKACGRFGFYASISSLIITLFGSSVVQILVCSEMMQLLLPLNLTLCQYIVILGFVMLPATFFGSPVDFSPVAFLAMSSTSCAAVLILIAITTGDVSGTPVVTTPDTESDVTPISLMLGFSSMCYAFSGTSCMPTIQNDMEKKSAFNRSIVMAYMVMISIYLPLSVTSVHLLGPGIQDNIIQNLNPSFLKTGSVVLMTAHVFCAYLILLNPVNLNIETMLSIPHSLNVWRCVSRTIVTLLAIFTALTIPKFAKILPIVGASAVVIQTYVLPAVFYYFLATRDGNKVGIPMKCALLFLLVESVFIAFAGTSSALFDLFSPDAFSLPCYVSACAA